MANYSRVHKFQKPSQTFYAMMKILRACSRAVGADILNPKYRPNYLTVLCMGSIAIYFIFTGMTVAKLFREDWKVLIEASCMCGSVIQGTAKLLVGISNRREFHEICKMLQSIYEHYEQQGERYVETLNGNVKVQQKIVKIIGVSYGVTAVVMIGVPFVLMVLNGTRDLIMHFHLPGFDVDTPIGYFVTNMAHCFCIFFGAFGLFSGDSFIIVYMMQCLMFADILKLKVEDINELVSGEKSMSSDLDQQVDELMTDIVQWHQRYTQYNAQCNNLFFIVITLQVGASALAILFTIFIIVTSSWPSAYAFLLLTIYNLYVYCILGTKIEITNEVFTYEIYNINWYNMRPSQQKLVCLMLMKSQTPTLVQVADVLPLSVSTALQITKTIYSMTMMMIQFLVE